MTFNYKKYPVLNLIVYIGIYKTVYTVIQI